ncbi:MAG: outer membrane beta-barrel protein [Saprospiraceae bacterium]
MKKLLFFSLLLLCSFTVQSQKYDVKGIIKDTLGQPLIAATVMLMDVDSILIEYTQSDLSGGFEFKSIREKNCLIKATYLGYFPVTISVVPDGKNKIDLGTIPMVEIAKELMEIVIKEAKAPLKLRGDTVEYDASQFKVPQGSTLEDLLRRLPGLEVSQDGSIAADGKGVTKLTVDGKTFFSEDPKFAIKNLPAEGVSKVQVFNKKDEESLLTGQATATEEKTMNIELKDEFKKGGFGKVTIGAGTESRKEIKGNYNKFNERHQISFVGVGNNTGRSGLSWNDFQDFMGSNTWNENDEYDYGFGNGFFRYFDGSSGSGLESKVSEAFFSDNNGGFPTNIIGGINYNYDHKKNKFAGRYFFQNNGNERQSITDSRSFLSGFFLDNNKTDVKSNGSQNHRAETMYQYDIDSFMTVVVTAEVAIVDREEDQLGNTRLLRDGTSLTSTNSYDNNSDLSGRLVNTSFLFRKKFRKAGRGLGFNASYLKTDINDLQKRFSDNLFYDDSGVNDSTFLLRQFNTDELDKYVIKANVMYSEPLSKKFFLKTFYNLSSRNEDGLRLVNDQNVGDQRLVQNDLLSRNYNNSILNQRMGSSLTFSHKGLNFTGGGAYQSFDLSGTYQSTDPIIFSGRVDNRFGIWIPNVSFFGSVTRNTWANAGYSKGAQEPSIENLLPIVDFTNPLFITEGNPSLVPSITHSVSGGINHSWPADGVRLNLYVSYSYYEDQIIQRQIVDENLVTRSRPENYSGGTNMWSNFNISFPIVRNKLKMSTGLGRSGGNSFAFVNDLLNKTKTITWRPNINIDVTPTEKIALYINSNISLSNTSYDINTSQNQSIIRQNHNITFNANFAKKWFWNSTLAYSIFQNERFGITQNIPIVNLSVYHQILKENRGEIRLSLYDAFNKNIIINQSTSVARVFDSRTFSLARYVMLSFSYNLKGMSSKITRDSYY